MHPQQLAQLHAAGLARRRATHIHALSRRRFLGSAAGVAVAAAAMRTWRPDAAEATGGSGLPTPVPGSPLFGGLHVWAPGIPGLDSPDAEPATITDFNGEVGLAYISGMVTRTNTHTGVSEALPFVESDMRFMKGVFRDSSGRVQRGAFAFI